MPYWSVTRWRRSRLCWTARCRSTMCPIRWPQPRCCKRRYVLATLYWSRGRTVSACPGWSRRSGRVRTDALLACPDDGFCGDLQPRPLFEFPRRRGDRDRARHRTVDRSALHRLAARAAGQGATDPRRWAAEPFCQARHADHGRPDDPDVDDCVGAVVDGLVVDLY